MTQIQRREFWLHELWKLLDLRWDTYRLEIESPGERDLSSLVEER